MILKCATQSEMEPSIKTEEQYDYHKLRFQNLPTSSTSSSKFLRWQELASNVNTAPDFVVIILLSERAPAALANFFCLRRNLGERSSFGEKGLGFGLVTKYEWTGKHHDFINKDIEKHKDHAIARLSFSTQRSDAADRRSPVIRSN